MAGKLDRPQREGKALAEIVRCEVTHKYPGFSYGEVTGGMLVLRAAVVQCTWNTRVPKSLYRITEPIATSERRELNTEHIGNVYIDSTDDQDIQDVFALPLHQKANEIEGIVLVRESGVCLGNPQTVRYRRVGYFDSYGMSRPPNWLDAVQMVEVKIA